jgi:arylsulfatase I/J
MATPTHTPQGRGFDTSLNYFHHANDYWDSKTGDSTCGVATDLWDTDKPAVGHQNCSHKKGECVFEDTLFKNRLISVIEAHDVSKPLFLYYAAHLVHLPYEVPQQYLDEMSIVGGGPFDNVTDNSSQLLMRMTYHSMVKALDDVVGNLTDALEKKGMWENTLLWFFRWDTSGGCILQHWLAHFRSAPFPLLTFSLCPLSFTHILCLLYQRQR